MLNLRKYVNKISNKRLQNDAAKTRARSEMLYAISKYYDNLNIEKTKIST